MKLQTVRDKQGTPAARTEQPVCLKSRLPSFGEDARTMPEGNDVDADSGQAGWLLPQGKPPLYRIVCLPPICALLFPPAVKI